MFMNESNDPTVDSSTSAGNCSGLASVVPTVTPEDHPIDPVPSSEAVRLARELYGVDAEARALPGEYDANFQLRVDEGPAFVLKIMHPARERALVELQCAALKHLALVAVGIGDEEKARDAGAGRGDFDQLARRQPLGTREPSIHTRFSVSGCCFGEPKTIAADR